jgi:hypothetical protein
MSSIAVSWPVSLSSACRITWSSGSQAHATTVVDGYRCAAAVTVSYAGTPTTWRRDVTCELIAAVRQVLPHQARATLDFTIGCNLSWLTILGSDLTHASDLHVFSS